MIELLALIYLLSAALWAVVWTYFSIDWGHGEVWRFKMRMAWLAPIWPIPGVILTVRALVKNFQEVWLEK